MKPVRKASASMGALLMVGLVLSACSNDNEGTSSGASGASGGATGASNVPQVATSDFTYDFSVMKQFTDLASQGQGMIGVLLPDTTTSTRYVQYDDPNLTKAFEAAGLSSDQFKIDNAQGSANTMQTQAEADINAGASVLLIDGIDSSSGAAIAQMAADQGVAVIDYDRLNTGGPEDRYYVSFNNVEVGQVMGQGLVDCIDSWKLQDPNILIMDGDPTDNNAKLFAEGYNGLLKPYFDDGTYVKVGEPAGTWDPDKAATIFQQQYTAHPEINAVISANDDKANAIISILKSNNIKAETFPITGQDASPPGLANILTGYQCGTVYKPYWLEAQAAAALALYLRAGVTPPDSLVTDKTEDSVLGTDIASVYTKPLWVTSENMGDTVVTDGTISASDLCTGDVADACAEHGIS
jgi:D-xylose transport system substrate-binding protein